VRTIANPVVYDREPGGDDMTAPPVLDEHGAEIRAWLASLGSAPPSDGDGPA
jgi:hypothetical protein